VNATLLFSGLLLAQPATEPPVVSRPTDWSGVVGGPFAVTTKVEPTEVAAEDQLTLTVQVDVAEGGSIGNLPQLKRPPLGKSDTFRAFAFDDLDSGYNEYLKRSWFRYLLRPRSTEVKEVPRVKFVYFNPRAGRYQTTYSQPVPLTVRARTAPVAAVELPPLILQEWKAEENEFLEDYIKMATSSSPWSFAYWWNELAAYFGMSSNRWQVRLYPRNVKSYSAALAFVAPPLLGVVWYGIWRRRNPDAARLANIRRSRAAAVALRVLTHAGDDPPRQVRHAIEEFLRARFGLPQSATTPPEVLAYLRSSSSSSGDPEEIGSLLRRCDDARFAPAAAETSDLVAEAKSVILKWDDPS
jgi:hypothetical protein